MRPLLVLAALALLASGCVRLGDVGLTAKEAQGRADARAHAWQADARFIGLVAAEIGPEANLSRGMGFGILPLARDPHVGDGRALAWGVGYASASANRTLALVVFPNGTILAQENGGGPRLAEVRDWVDSPSAADAAERNVTFARIAAMPDAGHVMGLGQGHPNVSDPVWSLDAFSRAAGQGATVVLGARTAEVLHVEVVNATAPGFGFGGEGGGPGSAPAPSRFHFQGNVGPGQPSATHAFDVSAGQGTITVQFQQQGTLPTDGATLELRDPQGNALSGGGGANGGSGGYAARGPGAYTAVVTYASNGAPALPVGNVQGTAYDLTLNVR
jgi:hypothetical protein